MGRGRDAMRNEKSRAKDPDAKGPVERIEFADLFTLMIFGRAGACPA